MKRNWIKEGRSEDLVGDKEAKNERNWTRNGLRIEIKVDVDGKLSEDEEKTR